MELSFCKEKVIDMSSRKYPGIFASFDGIDGAGKSTQTQLLVSYLKKKGRNVILTREPGGTSLGERVRELLLDKKFYQMDTVTELLLVAAMRVQHIQEVIVPALQKGAIVISDRFADATLAYQGYGGHIDLSTIEALRKLDGLSLETDITFVLDLSVDQSKQRLLNRKNCVKDRFESKKDDYLERVSLGYRELSKTYPQRIRLIEADASVKVVENEIQKIWHEVFD